MDLKKITSKVNDVIRQLKLNENIDFISME